MLVLILFLGSFRRQDSVRFFFASGNRNCDRLSPNSRTCRTLMKTTGQEQAVLIIPPCLLCMQVPSTFSYIRNVYTAGSADVAATYPAPVIADVYVAEAGYVQNAASSQERQRAIELNYILFLYIVVVISFQPARIIFFLNLNLDLGYYLYYVYKKFGVIKFFIHEGRNK